MMEPTRPNYFLLLELNPEEPWDEALYQKALQDKIRQWSRESMGIAKKALPAQANRARLPQIREVMENSELREKEADDARKFLFTHYQATHEQFERQITLLNMKEYADQEEIERFIKDFKHIMPAQAIQKRIRIKIYHDQQHHTSFPHSLDVSMAKNIADRLEIIHIPTLYELLQSPRKSTTPSLFQAAEELYKREVHKHPTAEVTARVELAGFAMSLFKTDETRAKYDETLRQMSLQELLKDITESTKRSVIKEVHPKQVLYYLKKAEEAGWSEEEALAKLKEYGRIHQWFITVPLREPEKPQRATETLSVAPPQLHTNVKSQSPRISKNLRRRSKALSLQLIQLVCIIALAQTKLDVITPVMQLLNGGNQIRLWVLELSIKNGQRLAQTLLASDAPSASIHDGTSFVITALVNGISLALILTPGIPILCILIGFFSGSGIGLKNLGETLIMAHIETHASTAVNGILRSAQKSYAFERGWHIEEQVAANLSVTFRNLHRFWFNTADIVTDWKWRRNRFTRYWIHLVKTGCQLAGLLQSGLSIEIRGLCTSLYTLFLLLWETIVLLSIAFFLLTQAISRRLHQSVIRCPDCQQDIATPVYICSSCKTERSQQGPSIYGIFSYRCKGCGARLPTFSINKQKSLTRLCPHCHYALSH